MAAKRITKSAIDWAKFNEVVPKAEKQLFNQFKAKSDGYLRRMLSYPETAPTIDWAYYKKNVINKTVVDQLESTYKALSITYPKDTVSEQIDGQERENDKEVQEFIESSKRTQTEAQKMYNKFDVMLDVKDMSIEEFALTFPDWEVRQTVRPSWWPHEETTPGLTQQERDEITKLDGRPHSLI
ncbi:ATP synthase subunit d, mitochondrial-like [Oppia nitens]|uniref:ATP synthase subunit d, mitochondrial-like n=1 Tax=Oppia nitens TaxID=1686743 RepID=UPI0023DAA557|nr:ATP synthase subunit d, mitochondrial-like [Oppia nitens]